MKWSDIPDTAKLSAVVVSGVLAIMGYLTTYQSDAEAQQYQVQHHSELVAVRIQNLEATIAGYRYQLLSTELTPAQREWIVQEIKKLDDLLACIRAGQC